MSKIVESAVQTAAEMERQLIERAGEDPDFRAQLTADPKAAVRQEFGVEVPDFVNIQVHEQSLNDLHLVLPLVGPVGQIELDEERLEAIAAGLCCCG